MSSQIGKPTRVATLGVFKDGHLLMGLRRDSTLWTTPGGHLGDAESPIAGALRELREETGIEATPEQMQYLGSSVVSGRSGGAVELHMFQLDIGARPMLDIRNDPDQEVHGWTFVDVSQGISPGLRAALHTPKNHLLRSLGLMSFDDTAQLSAPVALKAGEYAPPVEARRTAGLGLEYAAALQRKLPAEALARAKALVAGRGVSADEVAATAKYFQLYGNSVGESDRDGNPSDRHLEALLWGGPSAARWASAMTATMGTMRLAAADGSYGNPVPYRYNGQLYYIEQGNRPSTWEIYISTELIQTLTGSSLEAAKAWIRREADAGMLSALASNGISTSKLAARRLSTGKDCHFWKATDGKWYMELEDSGMFGPFSSEDEALRALRRHFANPGGWSTDGSGKQSPPSGARRLAAQDTSATDKKPTREVTSRPMHEVSADIREAGVDDNDQDPENDREIPGGPRRKTDGEMDENPAEKLET